MRFLKIGMIGALLFVLQLLYAASVQQSVLTAKSAQIALQTLSAVLHSTGGLAWVLYYLALGAVLHALLVAWGLLAYRRLAQLRPSMDVRGMRVLMVALLFLAVALVNTRYFPNAAVRVQSLGSYGFWGGLLILGLYALLVFSASRPWITAGACGCAVMVWQAGLPASDTVSSRSKPDVIIIGVDSLRHDHVHKLEGGAPLLPAISGFVNQAVEFQYAYTPMGRTYVAYTSLLTGRYPVHHGVRENLYPQEYLDRGWLLPKVLAAKGYRTVLALDESRFANLDVDFGFDVHAMPPSSGLDFVLAGSMDTLATNFVHLVPGGWHLLPHVVGNRAGHTAYSPEVHTRRVASAIRGVPRDRPLFLLAHHCVAHTPFWPGEVGPIQGSLPEYAAALKVADAQVASLLAELRKAGRLKNAIVVLLSDHGEGLGLESDAIDGGQGERRMHFGHGYPVYDLKQSHVLLALQHYVDGRPSLGTSRDERLASLVDIAPTVMSLLGESGADFDGVPLIGPGSESRNAHRFVYVESGIFGPSLQKRSINPGEVVEEFAGMYRLGEDGRFVVTDATIEHLAGFKQRMAIGTGAMYVVVPGCEGSGCVRRYDAHARKLESLEDHRAAADALCPLYHTELTGLCGDTPAWPLH